MQFNPMFLENNEIANNIMLTQPGKLKNNKYLFKDIIKVIMNKGKINIVGTKSSNIGEGKNAGNIKLEFVKSKNVNLKRKTEEKSDLQNLAAFLSPSIVEKLEMLGFGKNSKNGTQAFGIDLSWNKLKLLIGDIITKDALKQNLSQGKGLVLSLQKGDAQINIDIKKGSTAKASGAKHNVNITLINDARSLLSEISGKDDSEETKLPFIQIKNDSNTSDKVIDTSAKVNDSLVNKSSKNVKGIINKPIATKNKVANGNNPVEVDKGNKNISQNLSFQISRGRNLNLPDTKSESRSLGNSKPNANTKNILKDKIKLVLFSYSNSDKKSNKGLAKQQIVVNQQNGNKDSELIQIKVQNQSRDNLLNNKILKNIVFENEKTPNLKNASGVLRPESINAKNKTKTAIFQASSETAAKVTTEVEENTIVEQKSFTPKPVVDNKAKVTIEKESVNINKGKNNTDYSNEKLIKSNNVVKSSKGLEQLKDVQKNNKINNSVKEQEATDELKDNSVEVKNKIAGKDSEAFKLNNKNSKQEALHKTELSDTSKKDDFKYSGKTIADKLTKPQLRSNTISDSKINNLKSSEIEENNGLKTSETDYKKTGSGSDKTLRISNDSETRQDQSNKAKIVDKTKEGVTIKGKSINHNSVKVDEKNTVLDSGSKIINIGSAEEKKELVHKAVKADLTKHNSAVKEDPQEHTKDTQSIKPDVQKNEKLIANTVKHTNGKQVDVNKNAKPAELSSVKGEKKYADDGQSFNSNENLEQHTGQGNVETSSEEKIVSNKHSKFDDVIKGINNTANHKTENVSKELNLRQTSEHLLRQQDVAKEISKFIQKNDKSSISFDLEPRHLGKLKITLDSHDAVLKAHIQVDNSAAKQLIENNLNELLSNLSRSGVQMGSVNISLNNAKERQTKKEQEKHKINSVNSTIDGNSEHESTKVSKMMGYNTYEYLV